MAEWVAAAAAASVTALVGCVKITNNLGNNVEEIQDRAQRVIKRNTKDINDFGTFRKQLTQILDWLKNNDNDNVKRIGIHGTPGIGKTTIMENLNNCDQVAEVFDIVIWLNVSEEKGEGNFNREHLQHTIVRRLNLTTENRNPDQVAQSIFKELEEKKYLLLLDDVKECLDLCKIGIPVSSNGSKIVLTTRNRLVCGSMELNKVIKVEYLPISEAWQMFQNVIGNKAITGDANISPIARKVCEECCGLPLLITKVAPTFKLHTDPSHRPDVLDNWRTWPVKHLGGFKELYEMMRYCYKDLGERSRKCFLYGALYPEDSDINPYSLLECWEAEDLLVHSNDERTERVKAGYDTLLHLQDVSFLEKGKRVYHVTMDKFIRKVALYILEDDHECKHLVKTNKKLSDPPDEKSWSENNRISLGATNLEQLPPSPKCSKLSTLFLQENKVLKEIPSEFFNGMIELRVLDLSDTGITSSPSISLEILRKLQVLHLNNCKQLGKLPSNIERLEALEFLDIHGSGINGIPSDVKRLKRLKHLWVSFGNGNDAQGASFNYDMISELSELEELVIDFESLRHWTNEVVVHMNIMEEVAKLKKFKKLRVCFPNMIVDVIVVAPETVHINVPGARVAVLSYIKESSWEVVRRIASFSFYIGLDLENGGYCRHLNFSRYGKYVKYCNGVVSNTQIQNVLPEAEGFELVGHKDIKKLSNFGTTNMDKIQGFLIDSCDAMETIIDTVGSEFLPNLEELIIKNLPTLKRIWKKGPPQSGCQASKLTTLVISNCKVLVNVFPPGAIQQLREIQYLTIEKCDKVEEIIRKDYAGGNQPLLPNLKELTLLKMRKLSRICAVESLTLQSLAKLKIFECPRLRKLPFNRGNVAKLNCIEAEKEWWGALQLPTQRDKEVLRKSTLCNFRSRNENDAAV